MDEIPKYENVMYKRVLLSMVLLLLVMSILSGALIAGAKLSAAELGIEDRYVSLLRNLQDASGSLRVSDLSGEDTSEIAQLPNSVSAFLIAVSADNRYIAYVPEPNSQSITLADVETGTVENIFTAEGNRSINGVTIFTSNLIGIVTYEMQTNNSEIYVYDIAQSQIVGAYSSPIITYLASRVGETDRLAIVGMISTTNNDRAVQTYSFDNGQLNLVDEYIFSNPVEAVFSATFSPDGGTMWLAAGAGGGLAPDVDLIEVDMDRNISITHSLQEGSDNIGISTISWLSPDTILAGGFPAAGGALQVYRLNINTDGTYRYEGLSDTGNDQDILVSD